MYTLSHFADTSNEPQPARLYAVNYSRIKKKCWYIIPAKGQRENYPFVGRCTQLRSVPRNGMFISGRLTAFSKKNFLMANKRYVTSFEGI